MKIKGLIIHLQRARERLPQVQKIMSECPFPCEVVHAIDGATMDEGFKTGYQVNLLSPVYPFQLRPSEVAAFHSHRKCWQKILDDKLDGGLVLEDDVEFNSESFKRVLDLATRSSGKNDYIRIPHRNNEKIREVLHEEGDLKIFRAKEVALGAQAQLVTAGAARSLLELTKCFDRPIDTYIQMRWQHGVRVLSIQRSFIREISADLGGSTIQKKTPLLYKLRREINRFIYRRKVSQLSQGPNQP
jgi:glycosyl transferase family 25